METQDYITAKERSTLFKPKKCSFWRRLINQFKKREKEYKLQSKLNEGSKDE